MIQKYPKIAFAFQFNGFIKFYSSRKHENVAFQIYLKCWSSHSASQKSLSFDNWFFLYTYLLAGSETCVYFLLVRLVSLINKFFGCIKTVSSCSFNPLCVHKCKNRNLSHSINKLFDRLRTDFDFWFSTCGLWRTPCF